MVAQSALQHMSGDMVSTWLGKLRTWFKANRRVWTPAIILVSLPVLLSLRSNPSQATTAAAMPGFSFEPLIDSVAETKLAFVQVKPNETQTLNDLSLNPDGSLRGWHHPIPGERLLPDQPDRRFGARRDGDRPAECDRGHCGVDLMGDIGTPIHAALDGIVIRAQHNPDASGGRFVKLDHNGVMISYYMHLDTIKRSMKRGAIVKAGDVVGTLGDSAIQNSPPHLHFSVAKIDARGGRLYIDPEPMLKQAKLAP